MKKLILGAFALVASITFVKAQESSTTTTPSTSIQEDEKMKIKSEELPESIKTTLKGNDYKGWMIDGAYHYKTSGQYEVMVKKGTETKTFKFDKDGKMMS